MCLQCEIEKIKLEGNGLTGASMESSIKLDEIDPLVTDKIKETDEETKVIKTSTRSLNPSISPLSSGTALYAVFPPNSPTLTMRSGPGTGFGMVGTVPMGAIIEATPIISGLDRTATTWATGFGWVRLNNSNNWVAGWSGTGFSNSGFGHLLAAHARSFQGIISSPTQSANLRSGPGTEFNTTQIGNLMSLPQNTRVNITHLVARNSVPWSFTIPTRDLTQIWLRISSVITTSGMTIQGVAWVRADLIGNLPSTFIPVSAPLLGPHIVLSGSQMVPQVVISPTLNLRSGPGTHTAITGQARIGDLLSPSSLQTNLTEDRTWMHVSGGWTSMENTVEVEPFVGSFHVTASPANIRNAPSVTGTAIIGSIPNGTILRTTFRYRVENGMDWLAFNHTVNGQSVRAWIADVNGFVEGEVGSPGTPMPPAPPEHPDPWIDSTRVSLRNPDYNRDNPVGNTRPFYATRSRGAITQIVVHHTAGPANQTRRDLETGWRGAGWWNGGYHEMIHADGTVEVCYDPEVVTNGVFGHNPHSYHIALIGHFNTTNNPPTAQMNALIRRIHHWMAALNLSARNLFGHGELTATLCPGFNMQAFRQEHFNQLGIIRPGGWFVVTRESGGFGGRQPVRTEPFIDQDGSNLTGESYKVGYLLSSVEGREIGVHNMPEGAPPGNSGFNRTDHWQKLDENRWINSRLGADVNMLPISVVHNNQTRVVDAPTLAHTNVRLAPGTAFDPPIGRIQNGTTVRITHHAIAHDDHTDPEFIGGWYRVESGDIQGWVFSGNLR